jgi:hypothetical protein
MATTWLKPLKRRGVVGAAAVVAVAATAAGVLALTGVLPGLGGDPAAGQFPLERPFTTDDFWPEQQGVLHVRLEDGDEMVREEMWFDPRRGRGYLETRTLDGALREASGVDGGVMWEYDAGTGNWDIVEHKPEQAWHLWIANKGARFVGYHAALRAGVFESKAVTRDGQPALEIKVPFMDEDGAVEVFDYYLDPDSELPLGSKSEWLPVEAVDPALFAPPEGLPPLRTTTRDIQMTENEARQFEAFDIYYAGPRFLDHSLLVLREVHRVYGADWSDDPLFTPLHRVEAYYGDPGAPQAEYRPALTISSQPDHLIQAPWEEDPPMPRPGSPGRQVTVAGVPGVIFETPGDAILWFQLGGTVISISGENPQQVLAAAESLEKLN